MSLSSVSSALSLNERWVLLHRQSKGPRKGPPHLLLIPLLHPSNLQSSKELTAQRSASLRLLSTCTTSFPHHNNNNKGRRVFCLLVLSLSSQHAHPPHITLNQNTRTYIFTVLPRTDSFLSHSLLK